MNTLFGFFAACLVACGTVLVSGQDLETRVGRLEEKGAALNAEVFVTEPDPDPVPEEDRVWYALQGVDRPGGVPDSILAKSDGLSIRPSWRTLNPARGSYNFSQIDRAVERCQRLGKKLSIRVMSGYFSPKWLQAEGVTYISGSISGSPYTFPHPQSDLLVELWGEFLAEMGRRYANESVITIFHSTGIAPKSAEWHYRVWTELYRRSDFDGNKLADNWVKVTQLAASAFPGRVISCNLGDHGQPWSGQAYERLKREVPEVGFQINNWSAKSATNWIGWTRISDAARDGFHAGFQALTASQAERFGGTWQQALVKLNATETQWVEFYKPDVDKPRE